MIRFLRWLRGGTHEETAPPHDPAELEAERDFAESDVQVSRAARMWATRVGDEQRAWLAANHFGDRMAAALEPRGGYPQ